MNSCHREKFFVKMLKINILNLDLGTQEHTQRSIVDSPQNQPKNNWSVKCFGKNTWKLFAPDYGINHPGRVKGREWGEIRIVFTLLSPPSLGRAYFSKYQKLLNCGLSEAEAFSIQFSGKLLTYPSPPLLPVSLNVGLGKGRWVVSLGNLYWCLCVQIHQCKINWISSCLVSLMKLNHLYT